MLRSKLTIAGSNFIFNHINENYKNYLKPKNKLLVIFRGINLHYYDPKNISDIKLLRLKKDWSIEDDKFKITSFWALKDYILLNSSNLVPDLTGITCAFVNGSAEPND